MEEIGKLKLYYDVLNAGVGMREKSMQLDRGQW